MTLSKEFKGGKSSIKPKSRGFVLAIVAPSGTGKTAIEKKLMASDKNLVSAITATTRAPREGEVNGIDYHFKTESEFKEMIAKTELLEYAKVFGNYYGVPKTSVEKELNAGKDVSLIIDWQGHLTLKKEIPADLVSLFIMPPSVEELEKRLRNRASDDEETIQRRLSEAKDDMTHSTDCSYVVVNDVLEDAVKEIENIIADERKKRLGNGAIITKAPNVSM